MIALAELLDEIVDAALRAGADPERCAALRLAVCELSNGTRPQTVVRAIRVRTLEHKLRDLDTGERIAAICARTGISRSSYYRLLGIAQSQLDETADH